MKAVGIQFDRPSKVQLFDAGNLDLKIGDSVVVTTEDGHLLGRVSQIPAAEQMETPSSLPSVVRKAEDTDFAQFKRNRRRELDAFAICQKQIRSAKLPLKVVKALFTLGGGKVTYYVCSEERIDSRFLQEKLTQELGMKVEMRQIGIRDATGLLGGIGICGREYCCSTFLTSFKPISIKMAKVQNLSLNPEKVSGGCGRLRCCLQYELDIYHELGKNMPKVGKKVLTPQGPGKVKNLEILKRQVIVNLGNELGDQTFRPEDLKPHREL